MVRPSILWSTVLPALLATASTAHAAFTINVQQSGPNVVATGTGSLKTTGETTNVNGSGSTAQINSGTATIGVGGFNPYNQWNLVNFSGPSNFGSATNQTTFTATSSGDIFQMIPGFSIIYLPSAYVSGAALNDSATWNNASFATLNLTPGQYVYNYGTGPNADTITVNIVSTPEPATLCLLGASSLLTLLPRNRRTFRP
jgi:hypothetical protein